jgi:uncharacterized Zn-binding protein involved in type VI secretion
LLPVAEPFQLSASVDAVSGEAETAESGLEAALAGLPGMPDQHLCPLETPEPHGIGMVIDGSPTVLINDLPACRMFDTVMEIGGGPDPIVMGCVSVLIGGIGMSFPQRQQQSLMQAAETGAAFVEVCAPGVPCASNIRVETDIPLPVQVNVITGRPAARVGDETLHGAPLHPGPGSEDVLIGYRQAWRGLPQSYVSMLTGDPDLEVSGQIVSQEVSGQVVSQEVSGQIVSQNVSGQVVGSGGGG